MDVVTSHVNFPKVTDLSSTYLSEQNSINPSGSSVAV